MKKIAYLQMYENEINHFWYVATRNLMIDFLNKYLKKDTKILDVGCGTGGTIVYLKRAGFRNVIGVDNSPEALKYCKKRKLHNVKLTSVNHLPFKEKTFDGIICLDVLYHRGVNPNEALSEFRRVLKSGGVLYIQEPSYNWLKSKHDNVIETQNRYTRLSIQNLVKHSHFKIVKTSYFNSILFLPIFVKRIKDKFFSSKSQASDVYQLPNFINQLMLQIMNIESKFVRNFYLPWGLSVVCIARK